MFEHGVLQYAADYLAFVDFSNHDYSNEGFAGKKGPVIFLYPMAEVKKNALERLSKGEPIKQGSGNGNAKSGTGAGYIMKPADIKGVIAIPITVPIVERASGGNDRGKLMFQQVVEQQLHRIYRKASLEDDRRGIDCYATGGDGQEKSFEVKFRFEFQGKYPGHFMQLMESNSEKRYE